MGTFGPAQSNGLSAAPYAAAFLYIIGITFISDHFKMRGPFCALSALLATIGFIINATTSTTGPRYFSLFLSVQIFASVALLLAWVANIHSTESRRAGGYTVLATLGQFGPLLGTRTSHFRPYIRYRLTYPRHKRLPRHRSALLQEGHVDLSSFLLARGCPVGGVEFVVDPREQETRSCRPRGCGRFRGDEREGGWAEAGKASIYLVIGWARVGNELDVECSTVWLYTIFDVLAIRSSFVIIRPLEPF